MVSDNCIYTSVCTQNTKCCCLIIGFIINTNPKFIIRMAVLTTNGNTAGKTISRISLPVLTVYPSNSNGYFYTNSEVVQLSAFLKP